MRGEEGQNNLFLLQQIECLKKQINLQNEIIEKNKLLEEANRKLNEERNARLALEKEVNRKLDEERNARLEIEKEKAKLEIEKEKAKFEIEKKKQS